MRTIILHIFMRYIMSIRLLLIFKMDVYSKEVFLQSKLS